MPRAKTLQEAARAFLAFGRPLDPDASPEQRDFYIDRRGLDPADDLQRLRNRVLHGPDQPDACFITGQTGSGKGTEIRHLLAENAVRVRYEVILLGNVRDELPLGDLQMTDLLAYTTAKVLERVGKLESVALQDSQHLRDDIQEFTRDMRALLSDQPQLRLESIEGGIELLETFSFKLTFSKDLRKGLSQQATAAKAVLRRHLRRGLELIRQIAERPVLLVIDDTEWILDAGAAHQIFIEDLHALLGLPCRLLLTVPLRMRYEPGFAAQLDGNLYLVPNLRLVHGLTSGDRDEDGWDVMRRIVLARVEPDLVEAEALERLSALSGGHARTLARLCHEAFRVAADRNEKKLSAERVQSIVAIPTRDLVDALSSPHLQPGFRKVVKFLKRRTPGGAVASLEGPGEVDLLQANVLLAYQNEFSWYAVHPLVARHPRLARL